MALTASKMNQLNSKLQEFSLPDVTNDGALYSVELERDKPLLVVFICNHCPYVVHIIDVLVDIVTTHQNQIETVFISSNDVAAYPDDSPSNMEKFAKEHKFTAPYLYDESQSVAKSFSAQCTPDFFLYNHSCELVYEGQFDSARPNNDDPVTGKDLDEAMKAVLLGSSKIDNQQPATGCGIKWKVE